MIKLKINYKIMCVFKNLKILDLSINLNEKIIKIN
jgi:hypothetical protein